MQNKVHNVMKAYELKVIRTQSLHTSK